MKTVLFIVLILWGLPSTFLRSKFRKIVYQTDDWKINIKPTFVKEVKGKEYIDFDFTVSLEKLNGQMKIRLSNIHYTAYRMLYFEKNSEEDVAKFMGYKTNEKKRKAGYRQVKNLKKQFMQRASEIIQRFDIIIDETDF